MGEGLGLCWFVYSSSSRSKLYVVFFFLKKRERKDIWGNWKEEKREEKKGVGVVTEGLTFSTFQLFPASVPGTS